MSAYGRIVLIGFGGPESAEEIRPFLDRVLEGRRIPPQRYEEVVSHYEHIGGKSPFNELTRRQAAALRAELQRRGINLPVQVAYKNSAPYLDELAREVPADGEPRVLGIILAVHQSPASWDKYKVLPNAGYLEPFFDNPAFVRAHADRLKTALRAVGKPDFADVAVIFTTHSIPQAMADRSPYVQQLHSSAEAIAAAAGAPRWSVAYQSRSGSPADPWLEPDVRDVLKNLPAQGVTDAIVSPIGFLCDHVEVLYDLDVDAAQTARRAGVNMQRAEALNDHPLFISMLADLVEQCAG